MAVVDQLLISKALTEHSVREVVQAGIRPDHFSGHFTAAWQWILDYTNKHGEPPTERAFSSQFGDIEVLDTEGETFSGLQTALIAAYRKAALASALSEAVQLMNSDKVDSASEALAAGLAKATADTVTLRDIDMVQTWEERIAKYEEMRNTPNALQGISTGFHILDKITFGFRPQQFVVLAGEPKRGKSYLELIFAMAAHDRGRVPLFVSFEMSNAEQTARYDALAAQVGHDKVMSGEMSAKELERIRKVLWMRKGRQPFIMSEDAQRLSTISALKAKAEEHRPDILFVDGMYMMHDELGQDQGTPQALTNISRGCKALAQSLNIPVVGTTQVLPWKVSNKTTRQVTGDSIGYTSAFLQDADLILGVERDPEVDNQSIIRVVEARSNAGGGIVRVKWDWRNGSYSEVLDGTPESLEYSYD